MIKARLHGLPNEILKFKKILEEKFDLLNESQVYQDRGESKYWRLYVDLEEYKQPEASINEAVKLKNLSAVKEFLNLEDDALHHINEIPKNILIELLRIAIGKIDNLENPCEFDERDMGDLIMDAEWIFLDLLKTLQEQIDMGAYEEEEK